MSAPLSIPCDCSHCRDLREKIAGDTFATNAQDIPQKLADAGYIKQDIASGHAIKKGNGLLPIECADNDPNHDCRCGGVKGTKSCDAPFGTARQIENKAIRVGTALTREWSHDVFDAAIRRACEKAALQIGKMVEADDFLHIKTAAKEIERHVRQELGL